MCGFLLRIVMNALVLFVVIVKFPGIFVDTLGAALLGAIIIGLLNALIRPAFLFAQIRLNSMIAGGLTFATNALAPIMMVQTMPGVQIHNAFAAIPGLMLMTICSFTFTKVIQDR